jgi:hypothetical protein
MEFIPPFLPLSLLPLWKFTYEKEKKNSPSQESPGIPSKMATQGNRGVWHGVDKGVVRLLQAAHPTDDHPLNGGKAVSGVACRGDLLGSEL